MLSEAAVRDFAFCQMPTRISGSELAWECARLCVAGLHNIGTRLITTYEIVTDDRSSSLPLLKSQVESCRLDLSAPVLSRFFPRAAPHFAFRLASEPSVECQRIRGECRKTRNVALD